MSQILIDTHALIWFAEGSPSLSNHALELIDQTSTPQFASAASLWEMAIKISIGILNLAVGSLADFAANLKANDIGILPILGEDAVEMIKLPLGKHKDPFDRLIAAQCLRYDLTLVSIDTAFDVYGVRRVW